MSEGVIKIKGDTSELIAALDKAGVKFDVLAKGAERATRHSKSFGEAWEHANGTLTRTLAHSLALTHVLGTVAGAMKEVADESAKISEKVGGAALDRDLAAKKLGIGSDQAAQLVKGYGAASIADRNKFFGEMGDMKVGRLKRAPTSREAAMLQSAFNSGLYKEHELKDIAERGAFDELNVAGRLGSLGETARAEYNTRVDLASQEEGGEEARLAAGRRTRRADAKLAVWAGENPYLDKLRTAPGELPFGVGKAYTAINTTIARMVNSTEEQTDLIRKDSSKPTLAPGSE